MALSYTSLLTATQLQTAAMSALKAVEDNALAAAAMEDICEDTTDMIEGYLGRHLIVKKVTQEVPYWLYDASQDQSSDTYVAAWADVWPILQVTAVTLSTATTPTIHSNGRRFITTLANTTTPIRTITYYAGYKREDQTYAWLSSASGAGLTDLSVTPANIPGEVRRCAIRLAMRQVIDITQAALGKRSTTVVAGASVETDIDFTDFAEKELRKLDRYRALVYEV